MARPFFAYMLRCADESFYVGHTDDLEKRVLSTRKVEGAHTPRHACLCDWSGRRSFATREEALAAERRLKNWSRAKKQALSSGDFDQLRTAAKKKDWAAYRQRRQRL